MTEAQIEFTILIGLLVGLTIAYYQERLNSAGLSHQLESARTELSNFRSQIKQYSEKDADTIRCIREYSDKQIEGAEKEIEEIEARHLEEAKRLALKAIEALERITKVEERLKNHEQKKGLINPFSPT